MGDIGIKNCIYGVKHPLFEFYLQGLRYSDIR